MSDYGEPWKASIGSWDGTEFWLVEDSAGTPLCQEPTGFSAYASGAFITPDGQEQICDRIIACVNGCKALNPEAIPELLAACEAALSLRWAPAYVPMNEEQLSIRNRLRDAIAKAKQPPPRDLDVEHIGRPSTQHAQRGPSTAGRG